MAKMNGCNGDMVKGPVGMKSVRVNPAQINRANLAKGGVNGDIGGTKEAYKPCIPAGKAGDNKTRC